MRRLFRLVLATLFLCCGTSFAVSPAERTALLALYNSTNGANWTIPWPASLDAGWECTWHGVYCSNGAVVGLTLNSNGLTGALPSLAGLTSLDTLSLWDNAIAGPLPNFAAMPSLATARLSHNRFSGSIPVLQGHPQLRFVDLGSNQLSGPIPPLTSLPNLHYFFVGYNQLSGSLSAISGVPNLEILDVSNNRLEGAVSAFPSLPLLRGLDYSNNLLTGAFPSVAHLGALNYLTIKDNKFSGAAFDFPASMSYVQMQNNQIAGPLTAFSGAGMENINLSNNKLTGPIPVFAPSMQTVKLQNNLLTALAPLAANASLTAFDASNNALTGPIPALNGATQLYDFDVSHNQLSGSVPSLSSNLQMRLFDASHNLLDGTAPSLAGLPKLQTYRVNANRLTGALPTFSGNGLLWTFDASGNRFTGAIPPLAGAFNLLSYDVSNNLLTGSLPLLSAIQAPVTFAASGNGLSGTLPADLATSSVRGLYIANNQFSGELAILEQMPNLNAFNGSFNQFSGTLTFLEWIVNMQSFIVGSNLLEGSLPFMGRLRVLRELDVSNNRLVGVPSFTNNVALEYVRLQGNRFWGPAPSAPVPSSLIPGASILCPNPLYPVAHPAWESAASTTPWYRDCVNLPQTLSFTRSIVLTRLEVASVLNAAVATSQMLVTYSAGPPAICSMDDAYRLRAIAAGTCVLTANQAGNENYAPAAPISMNVTIRERQTINQLSSGFVFYHPDNYDWLIASASSGLPVTFEVLTPLTCRRVGDRLYRRAGGTCNYLAAQSGDANYGPVSEMATIVIDASNYCSLDLDSSSTIEAATDGALVLRAWRTGEALSTVGVISPGAWRTDPLIISDMAAVMATNKALDLDGNGVADPATDGVLLLRAMLGFTGTAATNGALGTGATRTTWEDIRSYLQTRCSY